MLPQAIRGGASQAVPFTAMLPGAPQYYGPTHQALSNALQAQLAQSLLVPGLLSAMQNNPTLAQQVGGLLGSYFQPNPPAVYRTDWTALPSTFTDAATAITGVPAAKLDTTQQDQARAASLLASYRNGESNATGGQHPDTAAQDRASNDENVGNGDFW